MLKKGTTGREVAALKARLLELGYWPLLARRTPVFDQRTHEAVRWFQATHYGARGLPLIADGIVGPGTRWALSNPHARPREQVIDRTADATIRKVSPFRAELLTVGLEYVGVEEKPLGSNRGPEVDHFIPVWRRWNPGPAWCAFFASTVDREASGRYTLGRRHGNCHKMHSAALERGMGIAIRDMVPGDLFFLSDGTRMRHVGFCYRFDGMNLNSIEGNSGHRVALGTRARGDVAAAVRLGPELGPGSIAALQGLGVLDAAESSLETR